MTTDPTDHPCWPTIAISYDGLAGELDAACGNCGTRELISAGGEVSLAELTAWVEAHCEADNPAPVLAAGGDA